MKIPALLLALLCPLALAAPEKPPGKPAKPVPSTDRPAAPASSPADLDAGLKTRIEEFFKLLRDSGARDAYDRLFEGSALVAEDPDTLGDLIKTTTLAMEKWGKVESASMLRVRSAGPTLKEIVCIMNCQKRPIRWTFYAYYGDGRWQIIESLPSLSLEAFFDPEKAKEPAEGRRGR